MRINHAGIEVYVYTGGEEHVPGKDTVVFIHGAGMNHTVWTLLARYWAKAGYNVAALDLPGHGLSGGDALTSIEDNAEFVSGVVQKLGLDDSVCVVGHSMGSLVALETAVMLKGLQRLAMLGTAVPMGVGAPLLDAARENDHASIDMISLFGHSFGSQIGSNPVAGISAQLLAERILESADDGVLYTALNACNEYQAGLETAAKINSPVGLILGELDQMTPARNAAQLLSAFPNAQKITLPDCGHMMMSEKPEATHHALFRVIEGRL